ncbi:MAG TPA: hypothetical protein VH420_10010 [Gaiellaceae bacterium]|jgi:hypothetical protein
MATPTNGVAPILELKPRSTNGVHRRAPVNVLSPAAEVRETPTDVVVRIRLQQGALELSVPKRALAETRPAGQSTTPGSNPDAAAC